ncbi:hypothetical protein I3U70_26900 [Mycobacteroides abscessus subsp. abscessus]|nr:hypothetical protein [Mycobacteroides abscessus subsp. abscessus]
MRQPVGVGAGLNNVAAEGKSVNDGAAPPARCRNAPTGATTADTSSPRVYELRAASQKT